MKDRRPVRPSHAQSSGGGTEPAPHGMWSGTVSFSLVAIPVQLVKAVEPGRVSFHLLHRKDNSPLMRRMFCPEEEKMVSPDEIIRGYEIGPETYVPVTEAELESVTPERSRTIEIVEFIDLKDVDPVYFDHPYYLVPLKGGEKAYGLLTEVMRRTNKAGLAKFVLGEREYLVAVKSAEGALSVITLHYPEEVLSSGDIEPEDESMDEEVEGSMKRAIEDMIAEFNPDKYADERRKKIMKLLNKKEKQMPPVEAPRIEEEEGGTPVDLVAVLEESMRKVRKNQ
jgi:DNA end-binding protein Ku